LPTANFIDYSILAYIFATNILMGLIYY
jgi:hypothetical protein